MVDAPCILSELTEMGVLYEGKSFVKVKGKMMGTIPQAELTKLFKEFRSIDYFSLKSQYNGNITDIPTTRTSLTIDGDTKRVSNYNGTPQKLEEKIDRAVDIEQWIGSFEERAAINFESEL